MGTHPVRSATTGKRSASTALAGTHSPADTDPRAGTGPFPKPRVHVLSLVKFGQSKPDGHGYIDTADSDLVHHQFRRSLLQWNPGPVRRNPTNMVSAACGKFHEVILQEASDHSTSKGAWGVVLLIVRGLLRHPSFTMSWLRNVMHLLSSFSASMDI